MTDDNGNLRDVAGLIGMGFEYTSENQLLSVKGDAEAGYVYDCFGHRREDTVSGDTLELYWHDGNYLGERNAYVSAGIFSRLFATTNGQITGFVEGDLGPLGVYLSGDYLLDFLGSVTGEVDALAALSGVRRFKPSGEKYSGALVFRGPGFTGASGSRHTMVPFAEQYNEQRVLSTRLMQWTTRDPIWPRELPYGYVNGNPTTRIDPSGLEQVRVQICAFINKRQNTRVYGLPSGWKATVPPGLYIKTDNRDFFQTPLSCRLFTEITIDSCAIGSAIPKVKSKAGTTGWATFPPFKVHGYIEGTTGYTEKSSSASGCKSSIEYELWGYLGLPPFVRRDLFPPIKITANVVFAAGKNTVTVSARLTRTPYPDFEIIMRVGSTLYQAARPTSYAGPEIGLFAPQVQDNHSTGGRAMTARACCGDCP